MSGMVWEAFQKNIRDYLGIFPNMGGGLPNSQNSKPKKVPLNHPKFTQKNKLDFSKNHPKKFILNEAFPKGGGGGVRHLGKNYQIIPYFFFERFPN